MPCWGFQTLLFLNSLACTPRSIPPKLCFFDLNLWNPQKVYLCCFWLHFSSLKNKTTKSQWGETVWTAKPESDRLSKDLIINNNFWSDRVSGENQKQTIRQSQCCERWMLASTGSALSTAVPWRPKAAVSIGLAVMSTNSSPMANC